jgi:hypothetical protein
VNGVAELAAEVRAIRGLLDRESGRAQEVARMGKAAEAEVAALTAQAELHAQAEALLTRIAEDAQETARDQVEGLATRALQAIFGPELSFGLVPDEKGGQAVLDLVIRSEYGGVVTETPVLSARGGGLAAVVGYVLRLVMLLLTPEARRFLALDESFAHVSAEYVPAVANFLREVADKAGVQHLVITHDRTLAAVADREVRLSLGEDGTTRVAEGEPE